MPLSAPLMPRFAFFLAMIFFPVFSFSTPLPPSQEDAFFVISSCGDTLDIGADTTLCTGAVTTLYAGNGFETYLWNDGSTADTLVVDSAGTYWVQTTNHSSNLITNGNFTSGNTGFSSSYTYTNNLWPAGTYFVGPNANAVHPLFPSVVDHTTGSSNYMIINGTQTAGLNLWCQTLTVSPNTTYDFSTWVASIVSGSPAVLQFSINGVLIGTPFNASPVVGQWNQFNATWFSGAATTAQICIVNQNTAGSGNDFGLDDISFSALCTLVDSIEISYLPYSDATIDPVPAFCDQTPVYQLSAAEPGGSWSGIGITDPLTGLFDAGVAGAGLHSLIYTLSGTCGDADTVQQLVYPFPDLNLPDTLSFCGSATASFDITHVPGVSTYLWSTGSTDSVASLSTSGLYWAEVRTGLGCTFRDSAVLAVGFPPVVSLGADTTICQGNSLLLDATETGTLQYLWQDGSTLPTFSAAQAGIYEVVASNLCGTATDQLALAIRNPPSPVFIGADTLLCAGDTFSIDITQADSVGYLWQDGSTVSTYPIAQPGTYSVTISNVCGSVTASREVSSLSAPEIFFPTDTTLCAGNSFSLDASWPQSTYRWHDGDRLSTHIVDETGVYEVIVSNSCGADTASLLAEFIPAPSPFTLGADTTLCEGDSLRFTVTQAGPFDYQWQDGHPESDRVVSLAGTYLLTISNDCGSVADDIRISSQSPPLINLGADTLLCEGDYLLLDVSRSTALFRWQDGSNSASFLATQSGLYSVMAENQCGTDQDSLLLTLEQCECEAYVPTAFSPNADGINDAFELVLWCEWESMELHIFNRWGNLLYTSNDPAQSWDGSYRGVSVPEGVYMWTLTYLGRKNHQPLKFVKSGSLTLIR